MYQLLYEHQQAPATTKFKHLLKRGKLLFPAIIMFSECLLIAIIWAAGWEFERRWHYGIFFFENVVMLI